MAMSEHLLAVNLELDRVRAERNNAEAEVTRLRAEIIALADEWDDPHRAPTTKARPWAIPRNEATRRLRALASGEQQ